jgi:hypothetical protein
MNASATIISTRGRPTSGQVRLLAWLLTCCFIAFYTWYVVAHSDFDNEDVQNFVLLRTSGFWRFLLTSTNVHFVPGHRLLTWVSYSIAPMNFAVAVGLLMLFQLGSAFYLYRILGIMQIGSGQPIWLAIYCCSNLVAFGLIWWAHAQHRAPYVLLDLCAIYHYLIWLRQGGRRELAWIGFAYLGALCFYEKAVFIPLHMLVFGLLLHSRDFFRPRLRKAWPSLVLLVGSAGYVLAYVLSHQSHLQEEFHQMIVALPDSALRTHLYNLSPSGVQAVLAQRAFSSECGFLEVLASSVSGLSAEGDWDIHLNGFTVRIVLVCAFYLALAGWTAWRVSNGWKLMLGMLIVAGADFLPLALSDRGTILGDIIVHQYRYYYEELHLLVIFGGLWTMRVLANGPSLQEKTRMRLMAMLALLVYASLNVLNLWHAGQRSSGSMFSYYRATHAYMGHLRHDLSHLNETAPVFENSSIPGYLSVFGLVRDTRILVPLFVPDSRFDVDAPVRYRVREDGHVDQLGRKKTSTASS